MNVQIWIHAMTHTNTPSQLGESNEHLKNTQGLRLIFHRVLIVNQWWEPLTSVREITIDVDDSQGTLVQYTECE